MLILIFCIALVIAIVCTVIACIATSGAEEVCFAVAVFGYIVAVIVLFIFVLMVPEVATASKIDEKIVMYEKENAKIEAQMDVLVSEYMQWEKDTFSDFKAEESSITLVALLPDLKSDELVKEQINIYTSNNAKIKELKEEKIDIQTKRWILFFKK